MMNDVCVISTCGVEALKSNSFLNYKISSKKLQCGSNKCKQMHIGSTRKISKYTSLYIDGWREIDVNRVETGTHLMEDAYNEE